MNIELTVNVSLSPETMDVVKSFVALLLTKDEVPKKATKKPAKEKSTDETTESAVANPETTETVVEEKPSSPEQKPKEEKKITLEEMRHFVSWFMDHPKSTELIPQLKQKFAEIGVHETIAKADKSRYADMMNVMITFKSEIANG